MKYPVKRKQVIAELKAKQKHASACSGAAKTNDDKNYWQGRAAGLSQSISLLEMERALNDD
jgi:hypothetical protein